MATVTANTANLQTSLLSSFASRLSLTRTSSSTNTHEVIPKPAKTNWVRPSVIPVLGEETMGRVYDALKRAESAERQVTSSKSSIPTRRDGNSGNVLYPGWPGNGHDHPWERNA